MLNCGELEKAGSPFSLPFRRSQSFHTGGLDSSYSENAWDDSLKVQPMQDETILCLSPRLWNYLWRDTQQIMSRLASDNRVVFV